MVVFIDPQIAGISGDMILSALINLGASKSKIIDGINMIKKAGNFVFDVDFNKINKHGIHCTKLSLHYDDSINVKTASGIKSSIQNVINRLDLSQKSIFFINKVIDTLIKSESKIHGVPIEKVHLHEASGIDTMVDIIGTTIALEDLNIFDEEIITAPVAVGSGTIKFSHGITSNPAYAIVEILKNSNISIVGSAVKSELTTPTGASILASLTNRCIDYYPHMTINSVGYGAGTKDFIEFANVLKIVRGEQIHDLECDVVKIIETNIDDISGEALSNTIEKIMAYGAKDVTITPSLTKKGRITNIIKVICTPSNSSLLLNKLIAETGTFGARIHTVERLIVPRKLIETNITIEHQKFKIRYKKSLTSDYFKLEYDDVKFISDNLNKPFIYVEKIIKNIIRQNE